jgi:hypothetical protein
MDIGVRSKGTTAQQARFESSVRPILATIGTTVTGQTVLQWIYRAAYKVWIEENLDFTPNGYNNASTVSASNSHAGTAHLGRSARGTRAFIGYSPNRLRGRGVQFARDEVLLHELCHALRAIYGWERHNSSGGALAMSGHFDNVEEFFAAMVTSVHSSEQGRAALGDHGDWPLRSQDMLKERPFITRLREFNIAMPAFCKELSNIPAAVAAFNPFRDIAPPA